jgi:hypothetical protein
MNKDFSTIEICDKVFLDPGVDNGQSNRLYTSDQMGTPQKRNLRKNTVPKAT